MLFNSYVFIFLFLPVTLWVFFRLGAARSTHAALAWLVAASLFFYGWWNPAYLGLLMASLIFNFAFGTLLSDVTKSRRRRRALLITGVGANLAVLGYFKYANFALGTWNMLSGSHLQFVHVILPLGISFITFQKIAYLVDAYQGKAREYNFLHFCLFVTFFPQLIAGPIVHHREVIPQFAQSRIYRFRYESLAIGIAIFSIGLFKKVMIADHLSTYASPVFDSAAQGSRITMLEAWAGALAYTLQLYFDFSGYSDMALGLGRMFGVRLPVNFYSPYKAGSIIDFWRRWHMTLSRFLRDYLYIPLGGNRKGPIRRYLNLLITMLLGGLWHGAGWTFVLWGGLHGLYLAVNHGWNTWRQTGNHPVRAYAAPGRWAGRLLTFTAVVVAWVFFRAENFDAALTLLRGMAGLNGVVLPAGYQSVLGFLGQGGVTFGNTGRSGAWPIVLVLLGVVWFAPNSVEMMRRYRPALLDARQGLAGPVPAWLTWRASNLWAVVTAALLLASLLNMSDVSEFLYFQF